MRAGYYIARFGRVLLPISAVISLLVCLALVYYWVRSHYIAEVLYLKPTPASGEQAKPLPFETKMWQYQYQFGSCSGELQMVRKHCQVGNEMTPRLAHLRTDDPGALTMLAPQDPLDLHWKFAGIEYFHSDRRYINKGTMRAWMWGFQILTVPYGVLVLFTAIPPAIFTARYLRGRRYRRRLNAGLCTSCGYDLRASSSACPECGAAISTT